MSPRSCCFEWIFKPKRLLNADSIEFAEKRIPMFWVMGPTNSGKTIISTMLAECSKFQLIAVSRILRMESMKDSSRPETLIIKKCMEKRKAVPKSIVINLIKEEIYLTFSSAEGFIISGFPVNAGQAKLFRSKICNADVIISVDLSLDALLSRILYYQADADIDKEINRYAKYNNNVRPVRRKYEYKIIDLQSVYPKEEAVTHLLEVLEDNWGYQFRKLPTR